MSTINHEQDAIRTLAKDLTNMNIGLDVHYNECGTSATGVAAFEVIDGKSHTLFIEQMYDWSDEYAYLPKLRMMRHRLEEMHAEALAERQERAA